MTGSGIHLPQEAGGSWRTRVLGSRRLARGCEPVMGVRERAPSRRRGPEPWKGRCLGNGSWWDSKEKALDGGPWGFSASAGLRRS